MRWLRRKNSQSPTEGEAHQRGGQPPDGSPADRRGQGVGELGAGERLVVDDVVGAPNVRLGRSDTHLAPYVCLCSFIVWA